MNYFRKIFFIPLIFWFLCFFSYEISASTSFFISQTYNSNCVGITKFSLFSPFLSIKSQINEANEKPKINAFAVSLQLWENTKILTGNINTTGIPTVFKNPYVNLSSNYAHTTIGTNPLNFHTSYTGNIHKAAIQIHQSFGTTGIYYEFLDVNEYNVWFFQHRYFGKNPKYISLSFFTDFIQKNKKQESKWYTQQTNFFQHQELKPCMVFSIKNSWFFFSAWGFLQIIQGMNTEKAFKIEQQIRVKNLVLSTTGYFQTNLFNTSQTTSKKLLQAAGSLQYKHSKNKPFFYTTGFETRGLTELKNNVEWYLPNEQENQLKSEIFLLCFDTEFRFIFELKKSIPSYSFLLGFEELLQGHGAFSVQTDIVKDKEKMTFLFTLKPWQILYFHTKSELEKKTSDNYINCSQSVLAQFFFTNNYIQGNSKIEIQINNQKKKVFIQFSTSINF